MRTRINLYYRFSQLRLNQYYYPCNRCYNYFVKNPIYVLAQKSQMDEIVKTKRSKTYKDAVNTLNTLQTPGSFKDNKQFALDSDNKKIESVPETMKFLNYLGISSADIDNLNIIHIAGTKGKGSTCAFVESILRKKNFKTGFFSSPHLVEVRERIRVNGMPISKDMFNKYFWLLFDLMEKLHNEDLIKLPPYFRFLTVMAYKIFIDEKVDVGIIEVGIGGEYDATNIVKTPVVCGITSLDLDHTNLLGNTLNEIAWNKAGIIKTGCPCVTVPQPDKCVEVIINRAVKEKKTCLYEAPHTLKHYSSNVDLSKELGIGGDIQELNASLALQICNLWLETYSIDLLTRVKRFSTNCNFMQLPPFSVSEEMVLGLKTTLWFGRYQIIKKNNVTYFIDGAHTFRSIDVCARWFQLQSNKCVSIPTRVLMFNVTGDRPVEPLLARLQVLNFQKALFTTNISNKCDSEDLINLTISNQKSYQVCQKNLNAWKAVNGNDPNIDKNAYTFQNIHDTLEYLSKLIIDNKSNEVHVLVTGSLHLIV